MKSRHIIGVIVGATIGMVLGYFGTGSLGVLNLLISAFAGALVGLYIANTSNISAGKTISGGRARTG